MRSVSRCLGVNAKNLTPPVDHFSIRKSLINSRFFFTNVHYLMNNEETEKIVVAALVLYGNIQTPSEDSY